MEHFLLQPFISFLEALMRRFLLSDVFVTNIVHVLALIDNIHCTLKPYLIQRIQVSDAYSYQSSQINK